MILNNVMQATREEARAGWQTLVGTPLLRRAAQLACLLLDCIEPPMPLRGAGLPD